MTRVPHDVLARFQQACADNGITLRTVQSGIRGDQSCCIIAYPAYATHLAKFAAHWREFRGYEVIWKATGKTDAL